MSTIEERTRYLNNPYFTGHIYGNFSPFYATISICTIFLITLIVLNVVLGCCSKHRRYWLDRHTGNRWLVSIWSATPHKQPPLDFTELQDVSTLSQLHHARVAEQSQQEYNVELEHAVPILQAQHQRPPRPEGRGIQQQRQREEYVELHKRESDI